MPPIVVAVQFEYIANSIVNAELSIRAIYIGHDITKPKLPEPVSRRRRGVAKLCKIVSKLRFYEAISALLMK